MFDFDSPINRDGTASLKWDRYQGRDIIPLWVADMDFSSPPEVIRALHERARHGVFGYTLAPESLEQTVVAMLREEFDWQVEPNELIWLPGLVCGLNVTCRAVGKSGDAVLSVTPIYPPFLTAPTLSSRTLITVPLQLQGELWQMDLEALEQAITSETHLLLLCNPHNPTGRVWSRAELESVAALAKRHDLIVCSDEIHSGLVLEEKVGHLPFAMLSEDAARRTITLNAPSKTFNIPGLGCSFAIISDPGLCRDFKRAMDGIVPHVNLFGYTAAEAAYRHGRQWRSELITYLRGNRDLVYNAVADIPGLLTTPVEATYLAWIDTRPAGIREPGRFFEKAGVGLSDGAAFGLPGFVRLNFGCRRELLAEALRRMHEAVVEFLQAAESDSETKM